MEDLSALFLWIIYGKWVFSVADLETALRIQHERKSLQPLAEQIKEKFSAFLELSEEDAMDDARVSLRHDSIAKYFQKLSNEQKIAESMITNNPTKGEIRMAQHFVRKLCDEDIYEKLGFEEFFEKKLSQSETGIAIDCENAQAKLALMCMRVFITDLVEENRRMMFYALFHMKTHLGETDLDQTSPRLKANLGPPLIKMFQDPKAIRKSNFS